MSEQYTPGLMGRAGNPSHRCVVHAAPPADSRNYFGAALCGRAPSTRWHGWQWKLPNEPASFWEIECKRCRAAITKATQETPK